MTLKLTKKTIAFVFLISFGILFAETATKIKPYDNVWIIADLGGNLSVFSSHLKKFIIMRSHVYDISVASNGRILFRDKLKNIHSGKLKSHNDSLLICNEIRIDPAIIDAQYKLMISDDGLSIFAYKTNNIAIFNIKDDKVRKQSELQISGNIELPAFSHDSKKVAFYNYTKGSNGYAVMIFDIATNSVRKAANDEFHSVSLSAAYALSVSPQWSVNDEYITVQGKIFKETTNSAISIIRLNDKIVKSSPSYLWADADQLACFEYQRRDFVYTNVYVDSIFAGQKASKLKLVILPTNDFSGLQSIVSIGNKSDYIFQDFYRNFYFYNSTDNYLIKLCQEQAIARKIFVIAKNKMTSVE